MLREKKGITLIALVITIIVLLILAGVTIATLTGDNGILTKATKAKEDTEVGEEKEQISIAYTGALAKKEGEMNITKEDLNEQFETNNTQARAETDSRVHFTDSDRWYRVDTEGNISGPYTSEVEIGNVLVEMFENAKADNCDGGNDCTQTNERKHLHIGDYVDLKSVIHEELKGNTESIKAVAKAENTGMDATTTKYSEIKDQTYELADGKNELNWRVLGIENGKIKLIAGRPLKSNNTVGGNQAPYLFMYGAKAYVTGYNEPNKICETLYKDFSFVDIARSVNMNDINEITGVITEEDIHKVNLSEYMPGMTYKKYGESYNIENQYTPESWLKGERTTVSGKVNGYQYGINATGLPVTATIENESVFKMLCENTENPVGASYWLPLRCIAIERSRDIISAFFGGPGILATEGVFSFTSSGSTMFISNGQEFDSWAAVRPVIVLESDVTIEDIPIITENITEESWNYTF